MAYIFDLHGLGLYVRPIQSYGRDGDRARGSKGNLKIDFGIQAQYRRKRLRASEIGSVIYCFSAYIIGFLYSPLFKDISLYPNMGKLEKA